MRAKRKLSDVAISESGFPHPAWRICYNMRVQERHYFVYILTNKMQTVLYTGVTNDLSAGSMNTKRSL